MAVFQAKTQLDDFALAVCQAVQHLFQLLAQHGIAGCLGRSHSAGVFDEVS